MPAKDPIDLVLLGAGPAHVEVLRRFALRPEPAARLTLVTPRPETLASAMLPGLLRGDYGHDAAHIELGMLAAAAGARLILAEPRGIDLADRTLQFGERPGIGFDLLSLDLDPPRFSLARVAALENALPEGGRVAVIGESASDIELTIALALHFSPRLQFILLSEAAEPLAAAPAPSRRAVRAALVDAGVELVSGVTASVLAEGRLGLSDGSFLAVDRLLRLADHGTPPLLAASGLACDSEGRAQTDAALRSVSHGDVFAAGETDGALLADNLRRVARGRTPRAARPQRGGPTAIGLGNRKAAAWWNRLAVSGATVWVAKDWFDRRWLRARMLRRRLPSAPPEQTVAPALPVLARHPDLLIGHNAGDGPVALNVPVGQVVVQTIDSLRILLDDPFLFGQIAAAHATANLHAMGARPWTALAIVGVPRSAPTKRARDEHEAMLAGATGVLEADGCTLIGGRSHDAAEASFGFAVSGLADPTKLLRQSGLRPGDVLLLTKPLGTGIILDAQLRGEAPAVWLQAAIDSMRGSNAAASRVLRSQRASACVAVNGMGLSGHLAEMLRASRAAAVLWPAAIPALPGAVELAGAEALLADPQSSGGLLVGVPQARAETCLAALRDAGTQAAIIGVVEAATEGAPPIRLEQG